MSRRSTKVPGYKERTHRFADIPTQQLGALGVLAVNQLDDVIAFIGPSIVKIEINDMYGCLSVVYGSADRNAENVA